MAAGRVLQKFYGLLQISCFLMKIPGYVISFVQESKMHIQTERNVNL